jgi:D-arginine dehydrogenase
MKSADIVIIGAGIAGASLAYCLVQRGCTDVIIVEKEDSPGYHTSGRSAAVLSQLDVDEIFMKLSVMSTPFFYSPPEDFSDVPLIHPNGILIVGQGARFKFLRGLARLSRRLGVASEEWSPQETVKRLPALERAFLDGGVFITDDGILDVHALLWGFLNGAKRGGARLELNAEVTEIKVEDKKVRGVKTRAGEIACERVVNAAGAWANPVALLAGARPLPMTPYRRHIIVTQPGDDLPIGDWPLTMDTSRDFYFRPESGGILASPMDQEPMEPCDARTDELQVARAADFLTRFTPKIAPRTITNQWAGLRTIAADKAPVVGEDPDVKGFFWCAGQAGHGMETSPALGEVGADLLLDGHTPRFDQELITPRRFHRGWMSWPAIVARRTAHFLDWLARPHRA